MNRLIYSAEVVTVLGIIARIVVGWDTGENNGREDLAREPSDCGGGDY